MKRNGYIDVIKFFFALVVYLLSLLINLIIKHSSKIKLWKTE